jgi:hypothetical protein
MVSTGLFLRIESPCLSRAQITLTTPLPLLYLTIEVRLSSLNGELETWQVGGMRIGFTDGSGLRRADVRIACPTFND